jgi:RNA-binding protein 5/10
MQTDPDATSGQAVAKVLEKEKEKEREKEVKAVSMEPSPAPEAEFEFADVNALTCLLCSRQLKTLDLLKKHNQASDLHKVRSSLLKQ